MKIGIDPGHGPGDGTLAGAIPEHEYCWDMAANLCELVRYIDSTIEPVILRLRDDDPSNHARGAYARVEDCRFVVSLHLNDGPPSYHGAHAYHADGDDTGRAISTAMMEAWPDILARPRLDGFRTRGGVWIDGAVVPMCRGGRERWPRVASVFDSYGDIRLVLVELFYATNSTEDRAGQRATYQNEMLLALARGIVVGARLV